MNLDEIEKATIDFIAIVHFATEHISKIDVLLNWVEKATPTNVISLICELRAAREVVDKAKGLKTHGMALNGTQAQFLWDALEKYDAVRSGG